MHPDLKSAIEEARQRRLMVWRNLAILIVGLVVVSMLFAVSFALGTLAVWRLVE